MHEPVLLQEVVEMMQVKPQGVYIDATVGSGGHAAALAGSMQTGGLLVGLDRDRAALERTRRRLQGCQPELFLHHLPFARMAEAAARAGAESVDGILLDAGVSSDQLDEPQRGFSFQKDGPLDMRMDPSSGGPTAADLVNTWPQERLADAIFRYGEERFSRRIARAIVRRRETQPFQRTVDLAETVARACPGRSARHPATRTFQALRMAVNDELGQLEAALEAGLGLLGPGGRMLVIAFHSIEDRCVKQCFVRHAGREASLPQGGSRWVGDEPRVRRLNRRVIRPGEAEQQSNPRSRSARLRGVERMP